MCREILGSRQPSRVRRRSRRNRLFDRGSRSGRQDPHDRTIRYEGLRDCFGRDPTRIGGELGIGTD